MEDQKNFSEDTNQTEPNKSYRSSKTVKMGIIILAVLIFLVPEWFVAAILNVYLFCGFEGTGCTSPAFYIIMAIFIFIDIYLIYFAYRSLNKLNS